MFRDIFYFHWLEEAQHAKLDELEWQRIHDRLSATEVDQGVTDLIDLVGAVDGILQAQAHADAEYFCLAGPRDYSAAEQARVEAQILKAYRWQYIVSGVQIERFQKALAAKVTEAQMARIQNALAPLVAYVMQ